MGTSHSSENFGVPVIDGRRNGWQDAAKRLLAEYRNFLLVVQQNAQDIDSLDEMVGYAPAPLPEWQINSVCDLITEEECALLKEAWQQGNFVFLVENLRRPIVKPPAVKKVVAYCEFRGVVGQADSVEEGHEICKQYSAEVRRSKGLPYVRLYRWRGTRWLPVMLSCD